MRRLLLALLTLGCVVVPCAAGAQVDDAARFEQGQQLYEAHCARCHGTSGEGRPPTFPALSGNDRLADATLIFGTIRQGSGNMPPFPALTGDETASLASYVRNAWTNAFGGVTAGEAAAAVEGSADAGPAASVWAGVFTEDQAARGRGVYSGACGFCHGRRLNGAPDDPDMRSTPPLARARFLREWEGRSLAHPVRVHAADDARGQSDLLDRRGVCRRHRLHAVGQPDSRPETTNSPRIREVSRGSSSASDNSLPRGRKRGARRAVVMTGFPCPPRNGWPRNAG